jgi:hypothetical protein
MFPGHVEISRIERRIQTEVFQERVLNKILEPMNDEVTGEWRRLHKEELCGLYSVPNIIRTDNSRRMRWAGHVTCVGTGDAYIEFWWGNLRERDTLESLDLNGRILK